MTLFLPSCSLRALGEGASPLPLLPSLPFSSYLSVHPPRAPELWHCCRSLRIRYLHSFPTSSRTDHKLACFRSRLWAVLEAPRMVPSSVARRRNAAPVLRRLLASVARVRLRPGRFKQSLLTRSGPQVEADQTQWRTCPRPTRAECQEQRSLHTWCVIFLHLHLPHASPEGFV